MAFQLATAVVKIGAQMGGLKAGLVSAKNFVLGSLRNIAGLVAKFGSLAGELSLGFAVKLGSDAQELNSMFEAVFADQTKNANEFANNLALGIGRSVQDIKANMAGFQDTFVPLGFARDEAAELSKTLTTLTADLASFKNKSDKDVARTLTAALTGEREALKGLGIVINEADVKNELLRMGMKNATGEALKQAKAHATLNLIIRNSADAQGDAARTAGSFANRMKGLRGAVKDVVGDIGGAFLPALAELAKKGTDFIRSIQPRVQELAQNFAKWGQVIVQNWGTVWELLKSGGRLYFETLVALYAQLPKVYAFAAGRLVRLSFDAAKQMVKAFQFAARWIADNWRNMLHAIATGSRDTGSVFGDGFVKAWTRSVGDIPKAFADGFKKQKLSDVFDISPGMKKAIDQNKNLIKQLQDARAALDGKSIADVRVSQTVRQSKIGTLVASKVTLPTGFLGFDDANKQIQQSLLDSLANPQEKLIGLGERGNAIAENMDRQLQKIAVSVSRTPRNIPVAT